MLSFFYNDANLFSFFILRHFPNSTHHSRRETSVLMLAIKKKNFPCNSASLKDFYLLSFLWGLNEGVLLLSRKCLLLWFWPILLDGPWSVPDTRCPVAAVQRSLAPYSYGAHTSTAPLQLPSSTTTAFSFRRYNNSDLAFLPGLCFSESGKLMNFDAPLTLPCWLSAVILLKTYWRHRPMDKSGINIT